MNRCRNSLYIPIVPTELSPLFLLSARVKHIPDAELSRIFQMPKLGTKLKQDSIPLSYTPRKFASHPSNSYFYIIEADHRVTGPDATAKKVAELVSSLLHFTLFITLTSDRSVLKAKW